MNSAEKGLFLSDTLQLNAGYNSQSDIALDMKHLTPTQAHSAFQ